MSGGLLVITAHPDDEALIAGGILAACAAAGAPTAVVCLTRGEAGPIADPAVCSPGELGRVRQRELAAACAVLGAGYVRCYRRADGGLEYSDASAIASQLRRIIAERRCDAVITFSEDGLYWHPDHIATLALTRRALSRLPEPPPLWGSTWPSWLATKMTSALGARGLPASLWDIDPEAFGSDGVEGGMALDVRPFVPQKLGALRCHRTQLAPRHAFSAIPAVLAERFLGTEWLVPAGGSQDDGWLAATVAAGRAAATAVAGRPATIAATTRAAALGPQSAVADG